MIHIVIKIITALFMGGLIHSQVKIGTGFEQSLFSLIIYFWSLGTIFGLMHHIRMLLRMLNSSLKLSVISFLTFKNGFLGILPLFGYVVYALLLGWLHGVAIMVREIYDLINTV